MESNATVTQTSILNSSWFEDILTQVAPITPFSFWIKENQNLIFSSNGRGNGCSRESFICNGLNLTLGFSTTDVNYSEEAKEALKQFLQQIINNRFQFEDEMNSFSAELLSRYEELNLLYELSQDLAAVFDLNKIFEVLLEKIEIVLDVARISIMLFDENTEELVVVAAKGFDVTQLENHRTSLKESISGYVLQRGEPLFVENVRKIPNDIKINAGNYKSESFISVPMICLPEKGEEIPIGVINVTEKRDAGSFTSSDLKLLNSVASIAAITIYNNRLIETVRESERLKKELEIAETIQLGLLPNHFPELDDLEISGRCRSATNIGGDYFDFCLEDNERLDLVIADVSGHNVSAALMMAVTRSVLRSLMQESMPVGELLNRANKLLFEDLNRAGFFISIFLMRYNRYTKELTYVNGGHHPVMWYRGKSKEIHHLDAEGLLLGVLPDVIFEEKSIILQPKDILVMYTDGLVEASSPEGSVFGYENLEQTIAKVAATSAENIVDTIFKKANDFIHQDLQKDDLTLQVLKTK